MAISNYYSVCRYLQRLIQVEATGNGNIIMLRLALTSWRWMLDVVVVCWSTTRIAGRLSVCCCCWWVLRLMAPSTSVSGSITRSPTYSESTIKKTKRPLLSAILSSNIQRLLELQFRTVLYNVVFDFGVFGWVAARDKHLFCSQEIMNTSIHCLCVCVCV